MVADLFAEVVKGLLRGVVFAAGAAWGWLGAMLFASYPVGGPRVLAYVGVYTPFALALAAPVCWFFAETRAAARWTLGYVGAWAVWFAVIYLAVWLF